MKIKFLGAARTVTGSRTVCSHGNYKFMVDCGLFQGPKVIRDRNWNPVADAGTINSIILTHAHIDHSGYIPRLIKDGFKGPVYCTPATRDLCRVLLLDAAHLSEEDALFANQTGYSNHRPALPLFTTADAKRALDRFEPIEREKWIKLNGELSFRFLRSGHILGSSFVQVNCEVSGNGSKSILFSGDLGNGRSLILKPPVTGLECDALVLESTYGNRAHTRVTPELALAPIINRIVARRGVLVIPAFSVGRTQEVLFLLRKLEESGSIPKVPVYVDSPMANHATEIFMNHPEDHLPFFQDGHYKTLLNPSAFSAVGTAQESIVLTMKDGPMIVVSAAGMLSGGRVMHHLKRRLPDERNAVLFVGYQAVETKGRLLQDGIRELRIHHQNIPVRAEILSLDGLSAHADANDLVDWVGGLRKTPSRIFLNHGDNGGPEALAHALEKRFGVGAEIPNQEQEYVLW
ncbi:MAG: MBL fold metallo-hydrolase [Bdellovibrionia bacterium]